MTPLEAKTLENLREINSQADALIRENIRLEAENKQLKERVDHLQMVQLIAAGAAPKVIINQPPTRGAA